MRILRAILALSVLAVTGCSAAGDARSTLAFAPAPDFAPAFRVAAARLEVATGLMALEDTQGIEIVWGDLPAVVVDGVSFERCRTDVDHRSGLSVPSRIVCDRSLKDLMKSDDFAALVLLHEIGHAFSPGAVLSTRPDHPDHGSVMAPAPAWGACLNDADVSFICDAGACSRFAPECG